MVLFYAALGGLLVEGCPFTYFAARRFSVT